MNPYRLGQIGVGGRGVVFYQNNHIPEEGFEIFAGADVSDEALEQFQKAIPTAKCCKDYRELLAMPEIEAVFIITPDDLHEEMACEALKAGKHVFLEKPLAITIEGCEKILRTAMECRRKIYIGHNMRFMPVILKMKEIIDSGVIGEVQLAWVRHFINYGGDTYFHDWHSERRHTTGLLLQKGAHDIDIIHWLMNSYTEKVSAMGMLSVYDKCHRRTDGKPGKALWDIKNYPPEKVKDFSAVIDVEDSNMIMMQLKSGKQCTYMQCHYTPDADRNYTFIGTRGRIENCGIGANAQIHVWTNRAQGAGSHLPDYSYTLRDITGTHSGADPAIMKNFREYVRDDATPVTSPIDAMRAVMVGVLAHETMRSDMSCRTLPEIPADLVEYFGAQAIK